MILTPEMDAKIFDAVRGLAPRRRLVMVCAWCADAAATTAAIIAAGDEPTHGICLACRVKFEGGDHV